MIPTIRNLQENKKIYFASDFHLGVPGKTSSADRERKIVRWLNDIQDSAAAIFLVGDLFDFWFEYKNTIPKGYVRFLGKLAEIKDKGIPVYIFTGNHDMWMFNYFPDELNIPVFKTEQTLIVGEQKLMIGHGDGLGPGDHTYKFLKKVFRNRLCQKLFGVIHPSIGISIANLWSGSSRKHSRDEEFLGEKEMLYQYCLSREKEDHFDYYIFGHRHLPLELDIGNNSRYINLGEWLKSCSYAEYDGKEVKLKYYS